MECYHCGQENNDGAVFCKQCGQRVDGKEKCPSCGQLIDCDSQFCEYCGCDLQEMNCDEEIKDGAYTDRGFVNKSARLKKKGETCCGIFSMATVFFSLLFTFFIGISFTGLQTTDTTVFNLPNLDLNLYYYFGDCYKQLDLIKDLGLADFSMSHFYFNAVFGTLLSLAIMLSVTVLAIITLSRYVNYAKGKSGNSYFIFALSTYITYLIGLIVFCAFNGNSAKSGIDSVYFRPNDYSIFGIILTTVCIIPAIVGKTSTLGAQLSAHRTVSKISFAALSVVILVFLAILAATPAMSFASESNETSSYNFFTAMSTVATIFAFKEPSVSPVTGMVTAPEPPMELYLNLLFSFVFQIAIIVTALIMIAKYCNGISADKKERALRGLGVSIALALLSIIYLILTINAQTQFIEYAELNDETISADVLNIVMIAIIGIVQLVVSICHAIASRRLINRHN